MSVGIRIPLMQAPPESKRYDRSIFLYAKHGDAQCGTCRWWTGEKKQRCAILGKALKVDAGDSCGLYVYGEPNPDQPIEESITPEEAGFVDRKVRCENCKSFAKGKCKFYTELNDLWPEMMDLEEEVDPKGCCTAQKPRAA